MLRGEHDVLRTGRPEQISERTEVRDGRLSVEGLAKPLVGEFRPVGVAVVLPRGAAFDPHRVGVPLCVRVVTQHRLGTVLFEQGLDVLDLFRPPRHGVQTPVQEDPELRVVVPLR